MAQIVYQKGLEYLGGAGNFTTASAIRAILAKSGYTVNKDHDFITNITPASNELTVSGYSRQTLTGCTVAVDDTNDRTLFDANDPTFSSLATGETITQVIVAIFVTGDSDSPLLTQHDLTSTPTNGGNVQINWDALGIFALNT